MRHPARNGNVLQIKHYLNTFNKEMKAFIPEIIFSLLFPFVSMMMLNFNMDIHITINLRLREFGQVFCESVYVHGFVAFYYSSSCYTFFFSVLCVSSTFWNSHLVTTLYSAFLVLLFSSHKSFSLASKRLLFFIWTHSRFVCLFLLIFLFCFVLNNEVGSLDCTFRASLKRKLAYFWLLDWWIWIQM